MEREKPVKPAGSGFCNEFGEPYDRTGIGRYGLNRRLNKQRREGSHHAWAQTQLRVHAHLAEETNNGDIALSRACGCIDHDESLCSLPEAEERRHDERLGKAHPKWLEKSSLAQLGTD
jgi:hypothetical protein